MYVASYSSQLMFSHNLLVLFYITLCSIRHSIYHPPCNHLLVNILSKMILFIQIVLSILLKLFSDTVLPITKLVPRLFLCGRFPDPPTQEGSEKNYCLVKSVLPATVLSTTAFRVESALSHYRPPSQNRPLYRNRPLQHRLPYQYRPLRYRPSRKYRCLRTALWYR